MKKAFLFDTVFDAQAVYRLLLEAYANPGRVVNIKAYADKFGETAIPLCIAVTLLDNETTFTAPCDSTLSERVATVTMARIVELGAADYVFTDEKAAAALVAQAKCGTLSEPHLSATIVVLADSLAGEPDAVFSGPGVDGEIRVHLGKTLLSTVKERDAQGYEYPTGVDLLFADGAGNLLALPRKIAVKEVG
jgi:alpha-D-ribose 1-methylphosphonate 5-triphosphate synthase subunit PhnH